MENTTKTLTFYIVRHGQSVANLGKYCSGQLDVELTQLGIDQALQAGEALKDRTFDKVYCSDLKRTRATCENVLKAS